MCTIDFVEFHLQNVDAVIDGLAYAIHIDEVSSPR